MQIEKQTDPSGAPKEQGPPPGAERLDAARCSALCAIINGATMADAAAAAGVGRATLYRWRMRDQAFISAIEAWRSEQLHRAYDQLTAVVATSTQIVCHAIKEGDVKLALKLLERLGAMSPPTAETLDMRADQRRRHEVLRPPKDRLEPGEGPK